MKKQILNEEFSKMQKLAGIINEGNTGLSPVNIANEEFKKIDASPLSGEFDNILNELENIISNNKSNFKEDDILDYFELLIIDKFHNPGYLDRMWR
jgi:hypothetical protein